MLGVFHSEQGIKGLNNKSLVVDYGTTQTDVFIHVLYMFLMLSYFVSMQGNLQIIFTSAKYDR